MPKKKLYLQVSFEQGMVDTIVSDYDYQDSDLKWQAPQSRSALYIENYDPTIVKGALTKRYGYGMLKLEGNETNAYQGLVDWEDRQPYTTLPIAPGWSPNNQQADLNKFTNLVDIDPINDISSVSDTDAITVCGATVVPYNKPYAQNVLVFFVRDVIDDGVSDVEHTRIVHYGAHTPTESKNWRNSLINGGDTHDPGLQPGQVNFGRVPAPSTYPGWDIRGTFTDAARHGGTLVVTSNVAKQYRPWSANFDWTQAWIKEMYPCYVWTFWDLRRKRNDRKYWQVISDGVTTVSVLDDLTDNYTSDDKYSQFKVLTPAMYLTRNTNFASWRVYTTSSVIANASAADGGDLASAIALSNAGHNVLNVGPQNNSSIEVSIIEARGRSFNTRPEQYLNENNPYDDRIAVLSEYAFLNEYSSHIRTIEIPKNYELASADNGYWWTPQNGANVDISVVSGVLSVGTQNQRNTEVVGLPLISTGGVKNEEIGNGLSDDDQKKTDAKEQGFFWTVGISLPNYLESNAPRPWLQNEEIPLLLTASIRGAEVLLSSYMHKITSTDYAAYPAMYWPTNYHYDATFGHVPAGQSVSKDITNNEAVQGGLLGFSGPTTYGPAAHGNAVSEQYYLVLDQTVRLNGRTVLIAMNRGFALQTNAVSTPPVPSTNVIYKKYSNYTAYCIEPFNPTQNAPYVAEPDRYSVLGLPTKYDQSYYHRPIPNSVPVFIVGAYLDLDNNGVIGFRKEHTNPKMLYLTIKIDKAAIGDLLDLGVESFNLYCAQPSDESAFKSIGLHSLQQPTAGIYMLPDVPGETEYSKYRLVKRYVLDGDGSPFNDYRTAGDIQYWKDNYYGTPLATNSWVEKNTFLIATGQHKTEVAGTNAGLQLTPDFILWDYPVSTTLNLNSSGKYWQGRGAAICTNIKGRTFIGGCIDQFGEEEQAVIRYSDVQSGVVTLDLFSEEGFIRVGGLPHVALCEYREQLWVFSRTEVHRIQMPDIVNTSTWEYLDKIPGQGTFNNKTFITLPQGVAWCNESGVWLSDGRMPQNLAEQVLTFYKAMATNAPPYYSTKINLPQFPTEDGYNPYLELAYDERKNELVVISPSTDNALLGDAGGSNQLSVAIEEWRLVYSFAQNVWRVEHADEPPFQTMLNEYDEQGKVSFEQ